MVRYYTTLSRLLAFPIRKTLAKVIETLKTTAVR